MEKREKSLLGSIRKGFVSLLERNKRHSVEVHREHAKMQMDLLDEAKKRKIGEILKREEEMEFFNMMVINNINLLEEMSFCKRLLDQEGAGLSESEHRRADYGKMKVEDLVDFYSKKMRK